MANNAAFVPERIFQEAWRESNFQIPINEVIRRELLRQLVTYSTYGIMFRPEYGEVRIILLARIAAINAYDAVLDAAAHDKAKAKKRLLN